MNRNPSDQRAPEGSSCAEHSTRKAQFLCPRCGRTVCIACWQPSFERCQRCVLQSPAEAAPPIAWERPGMAWFARYFGTLASVLHPIKSAPAFATGDVRRAGRFALYTALPAALIAGILPHTRMLMFEHLQVHVLGQPSALELSLDVARAMALEGLLAALRFGCLFFPFVSLVRAYASPLRHEAAMRMMFYRAWVLPAIALLYYYGAIWPLPAGTESLDAPPASFLLCGSVALMLLVQLMMSMSATARLACGLGPVLAMVVVIVPVTLLLFVNELIGAGLVYVLPALPSLH